MAAASLVDAPWSWHLQCPAVSITMSSLSSQLHALASRALLCRASELPHVAGPQRLVGIFTQASWTPFTTRSLLRPFLVQAVFKKLSRWVLLSQHLPCYPVRNRWLDPLDGSTPPFSCPSVVHATLSHYRCRQEHQPCHNSVPRTRATYNQALHLHVTQVTFSPVPVELLCPVLAGFMSI